MNKHEFIKKLYELISQENFEIYEDLFKNTDDKNVTDPYWKEALKLYKGLSDENKIVFFKILKQVGVDTASTILALIDGVTFLEGQDDEFNLTLKKTDEKINGDLQDLFMEYDENNR